MVVYLIECRIGGKKYNGRTVTKFHARANNYKSKHRNFQKEHFQTKPVTRNVFTNIICKMTTTGFVTGRSQ